MPHHPNKCENMYFCNPDECENVCPVIQTIVEMCVSQLSRRVWKRVPLSSGRVWKRVPHRPDECGFSSDSLSSTHTDCAQPCQDVHLASYAVTWRAVIQKCLFQTQGNSGSGSPVAAVASHVAAAPARPCPRPLPHPAQFPSPGASLQGTTPRL